MRGETIQTFIDSGDKLRVYCHNPLCSHHLELDMMMLRDRLGPHYGAMHDDLVPLLRCSKCDGKKVGLIRTPGTKEYSRPMHSPRDRSPANGR